MKVRISQDFISLYMYLLTGFQVYLPAIQGHNLQDMVCAFRAYLDFCYIVRRSVITDTLDAIDTALEDFHRYRQIFLTTGVRNDFDLPRQHAMVHYRRHIKNFGAPNRLCSSITESKHIQAVEKPWRRSNRYDALEQMLNTNLRLDKLATCQVDFSSRGMLSGTSSVLDTHLAENQLGAPGQAAEDVDCGPVDGYNVPCKVTLAKTKGLSLFAILQHLY
jgi:hypothetical protein